MTGQPIASQILDPDRVAVALGAVAAEAGIFLAGLADRAAGRYAKEDGSPAGAADLGSERLILARLAGLFPGVPCVAEESVAEAGPVGDLFFLVDPLDGTGDFLTGRGEYSVNIALLSGDRPVAAAVCVPDLARVWMAGRGAWAAPLSDPGGGAPVRTRARPAAGLVALVSRRHGDAASELCLAGLPVAERRTVSSAAKFCLVASGEADLYVRCGPTMEWDSAAGDLLVERAGGAVIGPDRAPLRYGCAGRAFRNGPFAALGDRSLVADLVLPATC